MHFYSRRPLTPWLPGTVACHQQPRPLTFGVPGEGLGTRLLVLLRNPRNYKKLADLFFQNDKKINDILQDYPRGNNYVSAEL